MHVKLFKLFSLQVDFTSYTAHVVCRSLKGPIGQVEVSICDSFSPPLLQCSFPFISFSPSFPVSLVLPFPGEHFPFAGCHKIRGPSSLSLSLFPSISRSVGSAWLVLCPLPCVSAPLLKERKQQNEREGEAIHSERKWRKRIQEIQGEKKRHY